MPVLYHLGTGRSDQRYLPASAASAAPRTAQTGSRRAGYCLAVGFSAVLLSVLHGWPGWPARGPTALPPSGLRSAALRGSGLPGEVEISMRPVSVFANCTDSEIDRLEADLRGRWRQATRARLLELPRRAVVLETSRLLAGWCS